MLTFCQGSHAVGRHEQSEIPDVQIAGGDQDAGIRCHTGDDRNPGTDVIKYRLQGRCVERRVFRLQNNVIVRFRGKKFRHFATRGLRAQALPQHGRDIRTPSAPIVVDVDRRDTQLLASFFQFGDRFRQRDGPADQVLIIRKAEIIDDVD